MMFRKAIILFMICAGVAHGQSTSGWQIVATDGSGELYTNNVSLTSELEIIKPAYFCFTGSSDPRVTASSVDVIDGTIESGSVTSTWAIDQTYLIIGESGRFDVRFTHTNITYEPINVVWEGYYAGNPSHEIDLYLWNYTTASFELILADAIHDTSGVDFGINVPIPEPQTNYNVGGIVTSRWYHSASTVPGHDFGIDYTAIVQAQINVETAGVYTVVGGFDLCVTPKRFTYDATSGKVTNTVAGVYDFTIGGSGTGSTNTTFIAKVFTNDVATDCIFYRKIGDNGDVGNAWGHKMMELGVGTSIDARFTTDKDNTHGAWFDFTFKANRIDD